MAERRDALGTSADRLAFLLALVPYLIDQVAVTVDEVAAHFRTTPERIRRAVELIAMSGVPDAAGSVLPGADMFDIDWDQFEQHSIIRFRQAPLTEQPRLSGREAAALIAGLTTIMTLPDFAERADLVTLRDKLTRGASAAVAPVAVASSNPGVVLQEVRRAQSARERLILDYARADGGRDERLVDPVRLDSVDGVWYLRGWCLSREAERTFRIDRIASVRTAGLADEHPPSEADPASLFTGSAIAPVRVELELTEAAMPLIADYLPGEIRPVASVPGAIHAVVELSHTAKVGRLAARLAGAGRIVDPHSAQEARDWAERAIAAQQRWLDS
jgi:proteasome accessory factor C